MDDVRPSKDTVRVAVRVRPLNAREKAAALDSKHSWLIDATSITQSVDRKPVQANIFSFDNVFQPPASNQDVFAAVAQPVVASAVDGINAVIFAYGQTAAGKTHTMLGSPDDLGVTPRAISAVFDHVGNSPNRQFLLRATYIEIYNEVIRDLLVPANDNLKIHEDTINKRVFVDAKEVVVSSVDHVMQIIAAGEHVRAVGETNMNDRSSRSHTIFSLKIESRELTASDTKAARRRSDSGTDDDESVEDEDSANEGVAVRSSTLSLVDLAGSERASFTKAQGMRLVEGGHINKSLLTLGTVINKLSSGESKSLSHIPYRDSKLTRLLQPALGGNARTAIICAVTPAVLHMDETLSTLKFASRAKKVTNSAKTNEFLDDRAKLRRAEKLIASLKKQLKELNEEPIKVTHGTPPLDRSNGRRRVSRLSSAPSPARPSPGRHQAFEKKFNMMMKALSNPTTAATPPRRPRPAPSSALSALHLMDSARKRRKVDLGPTSEKDSAELVQLRKRAFEAERRMRQALTEIEYERQAMAAEVSHLVATIEDASQQRNAAEREADEATLLLSRATAASLVDEVVSEAMSTSLLTGELRNAEQKFQQMKAVRSENDQVKQKLSILQKEHMEMARREKRGIGPILKQCKASEAKLSDTESKLKAVKDSVSKLKIDKAATERDLKERDRKIKVLQAEVDRHRSHHDKAQARVNREFKKKMEAAEAELRKTLHATQQKEADERSKRAAAEEQISAMEKEKESFQTLLDEECCRTAELRTKVSDLEQKEAYARGEFERLLGELSTLEKTKTDLELDFRRSVAEAEKLQSALEEGNAKVSELEECLIRAQQTEKSLQEDLTNLRAELTVVTKEKEDVVANLRHRIEETDGLKIDVQNAEEKAKRVQQDIKELQRKEEGIREENSGLKRELSEVAEQACQARKALEDQRSKIEDMQQSLDSAAQTRVQLEADVKEAIQREASARESAAQSNQELCVVREQAEQNATALQEVQQRNAEIVDALQKELRSVREDLASVKTDSDVLRTDLQTEQSHRAGAENRAAEVQHVLETIRNEAGRTRGAMEKLAEENSKLKTLASQKEETALRSGHEVASLKKSLEEQLELLEAAESKSRACETKVQRLEERLAASSQECERLRARQQEPSLKSKNEESRDDPVKRSLQAEVVDLMQETRTRMREVRDLSETIRRRDSRIHELEEALTEMRRGGGLVAKLEERIGRRDVMIADLNSRMEKLRECVQNGGLQEEWQAVERVCEIEAENLALASEKKELRGRVERLEKEQKQMNKETTKLRDLIKERDLRKISKAIERRDARLEAISRGDAALVPLPPNNRDMA